MPTTTTCPAVLLPAAPEHSPEPTSGGGPVLAVLLEHHPVRDVLEQAGALAEARGTGVLTVLLRAATPFSTDPALVAHLVHRRRRDLDRLERAVAATAPPSGSRRPELVVVPAPLLPRGPRRAWRGVEALARRRGAAVVVVPPPLAAAAATRPRRGDEPTVVVAGGAR